MGSRYRNDLKIMKTWCIWVGRAWLRLGMAMASCSWKVSMKRLGCLAPSWVKEFLARCSYLDLNTPKSQRGG